MHHPAAPERLRADMADRTYVLNEIVGTSTESVNDAIKNGINRANQTLRNLDWFTVSEVRGVISDGEVSYYQVTMKVGFRLEDPEQAR
jgi:flavin-binding protein dodecin